MRLIFLTKSNEAGQRAWAALQRLLPEAVADAWFAATHDKLPDHDEWTCDYLISYLCPRVVPQAVLAQARSAINFHPGPPEYPGLGCYNFAIYDGTAEYGVTCHRMVADIDSGEIYAVRRFPVPQSVTVVGIQALALDELQVLLEDVLGRIRSGDRLTEAARWARSPTGRADFETLRRIPLDADSDEVARRVRAFAHPGHDGAYIQFRGVRFNAERPPPASRPRRR